MKTILFSSLILLVATGCSHTSGFRSLEQPDVLVVTDDSVRHLEGTPSTITLVRDQTEGWTTMAEALLERADSRGAHYLAGLQIRWFEIRNDETLRCEAKILPRLVERGSEQLGTALPWSPVDPTRSTGSGATAPKNDPLRAPQNQVQPPSSDLVAFKPRGAASVSDPVWALHLHEPSCERTDDDASEQVVLMATAY